MPHIELRILGPFRVLVDGEERTIGARKQRSLIALLALRSAARSREQLIAELWPDSDEERGRESLRHALYRIRAAVGAELIASAHDELRTTEAVTVDVREFERAAASGAEEELSRAIGIYRGDLCAEFEGADGEAERARLRGLFASAGERLASMRLAADPRAAAEIVRRVIEVDPFREDAHRVLLRALAGAGDLAAAAMHYRRLAALLHEELGIEPSPDTKQLYASLARGPVTTSAGRVRRPSLEPPAALIGRRAEYARLMGLVSGAIDGRCGAMLVTGEAGAGKSRLLDEIASVAERHGLRVIQARATGSEGALPFQLWVDALAGCAADAAALPAPWPAVLATLLPEAASGEPGAVAPELRRTRLFEGVARLLAQVSAALPTALVLDDLHHADPDSIQLWHYVARTSGRRRLAIVAAARPVASGSTLGDAVASLETRAHLALVPVAPLPADAVAALLRGFGLRSADVSWLAAPLARWTGGNPFFVLEALRALVGTARLRREDGAWAWSGARPTGDDPIASELPPTVRQTILGRLGTLPEASRRLVDLGAVLGPAARIELLAEVAGRDEVSVGEEIGAAIEAGLLRETRDGSVVKLAFAHDLVRDATYQHIPMSLRAAIHRRVAAALERAGAPRGAIAFHLTRGGDAVRGAEHWLASAADAEDRSAYDDAIRGYRAALEALGPTSARKHEILTRIGDAEMRRGAAASAVAAYDEALALLPVEDVDDRATLSVRIASAARYYERHPQALEHATAAVEHYRARGDDERLASALASVAWVHYVDGDARAARAMAEEARAIARAHDLVRIEAEALHVAVGARWFAGEVVAAPDPADLERLVARLGDDEQAARLIEMSAIGIQRQGRPLDALALARRALRIARRVGSLRAQLRAGEQVVGLLIITGSYREAVQLADEIAADVASLELSRTDLLGELVLALALGGEEQRARGLAGELLTGISPTSSRPLHADPAGLAIDALLSLGDGPDPALIEALRPTCRTCEIGWHALAGRALAMAGEQGRALALADELEQRVRETGYLSQAGAPDHVRAVAMSRAGRMDEASAAAERARARFRSTGHVRGEDVLDRDLARISALRA